MQGNQVQGIVTSPSAPVQLETGGRSRNCHRHWRTLLHHRMRDSSPFPLRDHRRARRTTFAELKCGHRGNDLVPIRDQEKAPPSLPPDHFQASGLPHNTHTMAPCFRCHGSEAVSYWFECDAAPQRNRRCAGLSPLMQAGELVFVFRPHSLLLVFWSPSHPT